MYYSVADPTYCSKVNFMTIKVELSKEECHSCSRPKFYCCNPFLLDLTRLNSSLWLFFFLFSVLQANFNSFLYILCNVDCATSKQSRQSKQFTMGPKNFWSHIQNFKEVSILMAHLAPLLLSNSYSIKKTLVTVLLHVCLGHTQFQGICSNPVLSSHRVNYIDP